MLKSFYQVAVLCPSPHPEQEINQRNRFLMMRNKQKETIWEFEPKPSH